MPVPLSVSWKSFLRHHRLFPKVFLGVLLALAAYWYASITGNQFVYLNLTASLPRGIYVSIPGTAYRHDDIVVYRPTPEVEAFSISHGYMKEETKMSFLKLVGALPGETWEVDDERGFFIEGRRIGTVLMKDTKGNEMPVPYGIHVVPDGEFLPYTKAPRSFDGRYEGTVPMNRIITRVIPLITE